MDGVSRCDCVKQSRVDRLLASARIPQRYRHCEIEGLQIARSRGHSLELARIAATTFAKEYPFIQPPGLIFMGDPGVGKTHLAIGIIKDLIRTRSVTCLFQPFPELLRDIQMSYDPVVQVSEFKLLEPVLETEVLVVDELGAQRPTPWVLDTVSYILNHRYNANRATIITTNYPDPPENTPPPAVATDYLADRIGERMRSRLYEMCGDPILIDADDYRKYVKRYERGGS